MLLAAVAGGLGFAAKKLQEGKLQLPGRTKQQAGTSSGSDDEEAEEEEEGDTDYSVEDSPHASLQHAREKGSADELSVPASR